MEMILGELSVIFKHITPFLFKALLGILILLLGLIMGRISGKVVYKLLNETELNKFIKNSAGVKINAELILGNIVSYTIYFLAVIAALDQIGVVNITLYLLSAAVMLIIVVSLFLALKDIIPNLIAGIYLYSREGIREGASVEVNDIKGNIENIDLFHLKVKTRSGDIILLPNSYVLNSKIKIKN